MTHIPDFDNEEKTEENYELLSNKTAYALNVINDLMTRCKYNAAYKALQELRVNGRLFDSQKYFVED